jgi:Ca2+/H+ antiporter
MRFVRATCVVLGTILACLGLAACLNASAQGESRANPTSAALYLGVMLLLAAALYTINRAVLRQPPSTARRATAIDTLLTTIITGPALLFLIALATTIHDCSFGPGC